MSKKPPKQFWLVKQEPTAYAWETFVKDGRAAWTGVRNFMARNNLRAMRKGDRVFYYHSVVGNRHVEPAKHLRSLRAAVVRSTHARKVFGP